ncbi:hypothetical protein, partial [Microbispora rosea]|uniref:hypothetical protein n=1 Tax=Microbispora rosea TaxID=58117 RepID=UPI0004C35D28
MPTKSRSRGARALLAAFAVLQAVGVTVLVTMVAMMEVAAPAGADTTWSVVPANANGPDGRSVIDIELPAGQQVTEHIAVVNRSTQ